MISCGPWPSFSRRRNRPDQPAPPNTPSPLPSHNRNVIPAPEKRDSLTSAGFPNWLCWDSVRIGTIWTGAPSHGQTNRGEPEGPLAGGVARDCPHHEGRRGGAPPSGHRGGPGGTFQGRGCASQRDAATDAAGLGAPVQRAWRGGIDLAPEPGPAIGAERRADGGTAANGVGGSGPGAPRRGTLAVCGPAQGDCGSMVGCGSREHGGALPASARDDPAAAAAAASENGCRGAGGL